MRLKKRSKNIEYTNKQSGHQIWQRSTLNWMGCWMSWNKLEVRSSFFFIFFSLSSVQFVIIGKFYSCLPRRIMYMDGSPYTNAHTLTQVCSDKTYFEMKKHYFCFTFQMRVDLGLRSKWSAYIYEYTYTAHNREYNMD